MAPVLFSRRNFVVFSPPSQTNKYKTATCTPPFSAHIAMVHGTRGAGAAAASAAGPVAEMTTPASAFEPLAGLPVPALPMSAATVVTVLPALTPQPAAGSALLAPALVPPEALLAPSNKTGTNARQTSGTRLGKNKRVCCTVNIVTVATENAVIHSALAGLGKSHLLQGTVVGGNSSSGYVYSLPSAPRTTCPSCPPNYFSCRFKSCHARPI
jgi:hypothetical protein